MGGGGAGGGAEGAAPEAITELDGIEEPLLDEEEEHDECCLPIKMFSTVKLEMSLTGALETDDLSSLPPDAGAMLACASASWKSDPGMLWSVS